MSRNLALTIWALYAVFFSPQVFADEPVLIQEREKLGWRVLTAPFEIPPLVIRTALYPLKSFANWAEKVDLPHRAQDFFFNDERTGYWFPTFRTGGSGGFMSGIVAGHRNLFDQGYTASFLGQLSPEWDRDVNMSISKSDYFDRKLSTGLSISWRKRGGDDFFGTGNNTFNREFKYESNSLSAEIPLGVKLAPSFRGEVFGRYVALNTTDSADPALSLGTNFSPDQRIGLGQWQSLGEYGARIKLDTRSSKAIPESGTRGELSFSRMTGTNSFGFYRLRARLSQFFTLFYPGRVLALGARFESVYNPQNDLVHFTLLPTLGGSSNLRGFDEFRFRDKVSLIFGGEYRYPIWQWIDGFLFLESGRVAHHVSDLGWTGFHPSYGGGLRFRTQNLFLFQLQGAASSEGVTFVFSFNQSL